VVAPASGNCGSYCPSCKIWQRHRFKGDVAQTVFASAATLTSYFELARTAAPLLLAL
jgi:hypothetical protein